MQMHPTIRVSLRAARWSGVRLAKALWAFAKWVAREIAAAASEPVKRFYKKHRLIIWAVAIVLIATAADPDLGFALAAIWGLAIAAKIILFGFAKPKKKKKKSR